MSYIHAVYLFMHRFPVGTDEVHVCQSRLRLFTPYGLLSETGTVVEVKKNYTVEWMGTGIDISLGLLTEIYNDHWLQVLIS